VEEKKGAQKNNADKCFFLKPLNSFCQCATTGAALNYFSGFPHHADFSAGTGLSCHRKMAIFFQGAVIIGQGKTIYMCRK
jgi:hypothetical protein